MSKFLKTAAAALAIAAIATPALADQKISGYYRMQAITDTVEGAPADSKKAESQIDQRFRLRYQNNLNEYVHFVYFGEVDVPWGQPSKGGIGGGGKSSGDGVNVETKNVYLDFKIPDSIFSFRTGLQGFGDNFDNVLIADDVNGVQANMAFAPNFGTTLAYFKFDEGTDTPVTGKRTIRNHADDVDFYALKNKLKVNDGLGMNFDGYYLHDNTSDIDLYTLGLSADAKMGTIGLTGWAAYQFGTDEDAGVPDTDISAWAASVKAKMDLGAAKTALRLTYFSEDDDAQDEGAFRELAAGNFQFADENLSIFYSDVYYNNTASGRHAITDAVNEGYGLIGINATADFNKLPANCYLKTGLGYFMAVDDKRNGEAVASREGTNLGLEAAVRVGHKFAEKVDVSLNGAYAFLGDFYDAAPGGQDPDNMYKVNFMINVPY